MATHEFNVRLAESGALAMWDSIAVMEELCYYETGHNMRNRREPPRLIPYDEFFWGESHFVYKRLASRAS